MSSGKLMAVFVIAGLAAWTIGCGKSAKPGDGVSGSSSRPDATSAKPGSGEAIGAEKIAQVDLSEKFAAVRLDMTIEQVTALMGSPKSTSGAGENATYAWEDAKARYVIGFQSGKPFTIQKEVKGG